MAKKGSALKALVRYIVMLVPVSCHCLWRILNLKEPHLVCTLTAEKRRMPALVFCTCGYGLENVDEPGRTELLRIVRKEK